jgi:hypothetical protein
LFEPPAVGLFAPVVVAAQGNADSFTYRSLTWDDAVADAIGDAIVTCGGYVAFRKMAAMSSAGSHRWRQAGL